MTKRKPPSDPNKAAKSIIDQVIGLSGDHPEKNPAAVALGRLGGLKGGKARALKLTKQERKEIAVKAAKKRWKKD